MSFGMGKQSSQQEQSHGLTPDVRGAFSNRADQLFGDVQRYSSEAAADPGGLEFMPVVNKLLPMGKYGMAQSADTGAFQLGRDMFTKAAGNRAQRGFRTPYNLEGVMGDALRMSSAQLIPQANAFALSRAQMAPQLRQARFGYQMTPMQTIQQLLSGSGSGKGESGGFGFNIAAPASKG